MHRSRRPTVREGDLPPAETLPGMRRRAETPESAEIPSELLPLLPGAGQREAERETRQATPARTRRGRGGCETRRERAPRQLAAGGSIATAPRPVSGRFGDTATSTTKSWDFIPSRQDTPCRQYRRKFPCSTATGGSGSARPASPAQHRGRSDGPASSGTSQPHRGRNERPQRTGPARSRAVRSVRTLTEPRSTRSCCRATLSLPSAAATRSAPARCNVTGDGTWPRPR